MVILKREVLEMRKRMEQSTKMDTEMVVIRMVIVSARRIVFLLEMRD